MAEQTINIVVKREGGGSSALGTTAKNSAQGASVPSTNWFKLGSAATSTASSSAGAAAVGSGGATAAGASGIAAVAGPVGLALVAVAAAATVVVAGFSALRGALNDAVVSLGGFSGDVTVARAESQVRMINAQLRRADRIGEELAAFETQRGRGEEALYDIKTTLLETVAPTITDLSENINNWLIVTDDALKKHNEDNPGGIGGTVKDVMVKGLPLAFGPIFAPIIYGLQQIFPLLQEQVDQKAEEIRRERDKEFRNFQSDIDLFLNNGGRLINTEVELEHEGPFGNNAGGLGGRF